MNRAIHGEFLGKYDGVSEREQYFYDMRKDRDGNVPTERYAAAKEYVQSNMLKGKKMYLRKDINYHQ